MSGETITIWTAMSNSGRYGCPRASTGTGIERMITRSRTMPRWLAMLLSMSAVPRAAELELAPAVSVVTLLGGDPACAVGLPDGSPTGVPREGGAGGSGGFARLMCSGARRAPDATRTV